MAALDDDVKAFIVRALACFDSPETVAKAVKAEFGLGVTRQQCEAYDPNKAIGAKLGEKWKTLFEDTRAAFRDDIARIGIANRAVRLRRLDRMAQKAEDMGAIAVAASLMEQAAKEVGEAYTNKQRHELTGKDGAPIATETNVVAIYELPSNGRS